MDEGLSIDGPLWQFALAFYGREGVANACLKLQELVGADVNVLIFSVYVATHHQCLLGPAQLARADAAVQSWRSDVVASLRRVRVRLRTGPSPAPNLSTEVLRSQIKASELLAEKIELAALSKWFEVEAPAAISSIDIAHALRIAIDFYISRHAVDMFTHGDEIESAIRALVL